jgi:hypothetical protein
MSTEQPEPLRLAAALDALLGYRGINANVGKAAAELRRLHSENERLQETVEQEQIYRIRVWVAKASGAI